METINSKKLLRLSLSFFNILLGVFIGIVILFIVFSVFDLLNAHGHDRGFYLLLSRLSIDIPSPTHDYYGKVAIFNALADKYLTKIFRFLYSGIYLTGILYVLFKIIKILKLSCGETPFTESASSELKKIGIAIIFVPIMALVIWIFLFLNLTGGFKYRFYYGENWSLSVFALQVFMYWFYYAIIGIFFFALGEVFSRGLQLKQENDLTV